MVNIPLLRKTVEWVETQEQITEGREWYQGWWISDRKDIEDDEVDTTHFCDTAYCVAGKVVLDDGWHPRAGGTVVEKGGVRWDISAVAIDLLGITEDEGELLFDGNNDAKTIRQIAEDIAGERL